MEITNYQNLVGYWWYAVDSNGYIATFNNAGIGEMPPCLRQDKGRYDEMVNAWEDYIEKNLPIRGSASAGIITPSAIRTIERRGIAMEEYGGDARRDAERGFFVYEAELDHTSKYYGKFLRLFTPNTPLRLGELDESVKSKLLLVTKPVLFVDKDIFSSEEIVSLFSTFT